MAAGFPGTDFPRRSLAAAVALVRDARDGGAAFYFRLESVVMARHRRPFDRFAGEFLDAAQEVVLLGRGEARGAAAGFGARGAADAVDVILGDVREIEVHHVADLGDVDAAGGDVGRHQHARLAGLERVHRGAALALRAVGVDDGHL